METDACYFRRRADEEFSAAKDAACEYSRAAHFQLGERFAQLAAAIEEANSKIGPLRSEPVLTLVQSSAAIR